MRDVEQAKKAVRFRLKRPRLPTDGRALVAIVAMTAASAASGAGLIPIGLALPIGLLAVATLLAWMNSLAAAERLATDLSYGSDAKAMSLAQTLARLAEMHRDACGAKSPATPMADRERFLLAMAQDLAIDAVGGVVGALRFVDFDRLAAFDPAAAQVALSQFRRRLRNATSPVHRLAQIDRDSFGIWFRSADTEKAIAEFRAIAYVAVQELDVTDQVLAPTIEAGLAVHPDDGDDAERLLLRATAAFNGQSIGHAGKPALAGRPAAESAREQFSLEQGLSRAIVEDQLSMVFQPVIDAGSARLIGAEALLRWRHPTLGQVPPSRFIPLVEAIGLSDSYGLWVLNAACKEARRWQDEGLGGLKIAVNLSARQLLDPQLREKVERTLQRHALSAASLELELTETAAMADAERTLQLFRGLRAMGVSLAIDDFGAGYSSLSYLKNLPFDKLKIDREFVTNVQDRRDNRAICRALIELGRGLGLQVLAEGVETAQEVRALRRLGCQIFQGFYYSRPLSGLDFLTAARAAIWPTAASSANLSPNLQQSTLPA